jgi:glycosyltransferase involved in cell wall biosynthesis/Tfp pilus assembly protein PilF
MATRKKRNHKNMKIPRVKTVPTISACMIVKNEEAMLPRCLESIKDWANEIVIVDTGSTDKTVAIAESFGARVYHHPWKNDFSLHRNQSISYATGRWIFIIDADEELVQEDAPLLLDAVQNEELDAIMIQVVSHFRQGRSKGIQSVERLFHRNGAIHYEGRVHNRVVGITKARVYPIRLIHHGYDLGQIHSSKKFDRTVSLLKMDLEDDPFNPKTYHYLSCSYLSEGMIDKALESSLRAIELAEARDDRNLIFLWSRYNAAICLYRRKEYDRAEGIALGALNRYPKHIDSHLILLLIAYERGEWRKVLQHGSEYLRLMLRLHATPVEFDNLITCSVNEEWNMHILMGIARFELGQIAMFEKSVEQAVESAPERYVALRATGIYLYNKGYGERARPYLERVLAEAPDENTARRLLDEISGSRTVGKKEPIISCCMIVKNEETFLKQCLESVKDYVDEIIIVDTGSTDGTLEIAKQYTEKVYFHPWEGSFSKARNQALTYASGDWIFIIDADEEIVQESDKKLREAVRDAGSADAIYCNIISTYSNGAKSSRHNSERLFRNNGVIHYEGIVHNRVEGPSKIAASKIEIMHYGYNVDEKKAQEKFLRTSELLKKQIAENPQDPRPHHYLGTSYLSRGMKEEAAKESVMAIDLAERKNDNHPLYLWARHNAAIAFFRMGALDKAEEYSQEALRKYPDHLDSYYTLTMVAGERGQWKDVLSWGAKFLELLDIFENNPEKAGVVINSAMSEGPSVHLLIGHAWNALGEISNMEEEYQLAADLAEEKWQAWWNAGCFHLDRTGDLDRAKRYLETALSAAPEKQEIWYMLAKLYKTAKSYPEEKRCLDRLFALGNRDIMILNRLALLRIESREEAKAIEALNEVLRIEPSNYTALCSLGRVYKCLNLMNQALGAFTKALKIASHGIDPLIGLGEISLQLDQLNEARTFFENVLSLQPGIVKALLYLCEIDLKENKLLDFVGRCDLVLKELGLNRNILINDTDDLVGILLEINFALKDQPEISSQAKKVLGLLPSDFQNFMSTRFDRLIKDRGPEKIAFYREGLQGLIGN